MPSLVSRLSQRLLKQHPQCCVVDVVKMLLSVIGSPGSPQGPPQVSSQVARDVLFSLCALSTESLQHLLKWGNTLEWPPTLIKNIRTGDYTGVTQAKKIMEHRTLMDREHLCVRMTTGGHRCPKCGYDAVTSAPSSGNRGASKTHTLDHVCNYCESRVEI